jgi:hypothetical protein
LRKAIGINPISSDYNLDMDLSDDSEGENESNNGNKADQENNCDKGITL